MEFQLKNFSAAAIWPQKTSFSIEVISITIIHCIVQPHNSLIVSQYVSEAQRLRLLMIASGYYDNEKNFKVMTC